MQVRRAMLGRANLRHPPDHPTLNGFARLSTPIRGMMHPASGGEDTMAYINGMVCAVPTADKEIYTKFAADMAVVFKDCGATEVVDTWGVEVPEGKVTDYYRAVQAKPDETIVFSWVTWPDKAAHDAGWEKAMKDPRMADVKMPFDGKRMIYGSFEKL